MDSLKQWRYKHHLTTTEAAKRFGVTDATWRNWEHGRTVPAQSHIMNLSRTTGVPVEKLYKEPSRA